MKKELYLCGDKDLKITVDDNSDLIGVSFHCERLVTATELMELEDWIHKVVEEKQKQMKGEIK